MEKTCSGSTGGEGTKGRGGESSLLKTETEHPCVRLQLNSARHQDRQAVNFVKNRRNAKSIEQHNTDDGR